SAEKAISKALRGVTIIGLASEKGQVLTMAPVDNLSDVTAALKTDRPVVVDEGRRRILVKMGSSETTTGGLASAGPCGLSNLPESDTTATADSPDGSDTGPNWPELEVPFPGVPAGHWPSTAQLIEQVGRDRIAFVEVTNAPGDPTAQRALREALRM